MKFQAGALAIFWLLVLCCAAQAAQREKAALLYNMGTGKILYEHNQNQPIPPASLTKIMTMFLAMDAIKAKKLSLNQKITIDRAIARTAGSAMRLDPGDKVPVVRLLAGMAIASGNDAATAIARQVGGSTGKFVAMMNNKARRLGMTNTRYKTPTGLPSPGQATTARDLLRLCVAYLKKHPDAARFHKMAYYTHKGYAVRNTNPLLGRMAGVDGLKTGWTIASGYNLVVTAKRGKTSLLAIILGAPTKDARDLVARRLLEAGFAHPGNPVKVRGLMNGKK